MYQIIGAEASARAAGLHTGTGKTRRAQRNRRARRAQRFNTGAGTLYTAFFFRYMA